MSEIRTNSAGEDYFHADAGYIVPTKPKTRSVYDYETRKHNQLGDYKLKQLVKAEKYYTLIKDVVKEEFGDAFIVKQNSETNRVASVISKDLFMKEPDRKLWGWHDWSDLSLFTLSLQQGLVFNFPVRKLETLFKVDFKVSEERTKTGSGNKGFTVKESLKFFRMTKEAIGNLFAEKGLNMSDDDFSKMIAMFKMHSSGIIMCEMDEWVKYVDAGMDLDTVAFGFNRRLLLGKNIPFIPVSQVEEYKGLPIEWVEGILAQDKNG